MSSVIGPPPDDVISRTVDDELVLYRASTGAVVTLNATAGAIWALADGTRDLDGIVADLAARYERPPTEIAEDVSRLVERLRETGFLPE